MKNTSIGIVAVLALVLAGYQFFKAPVDPNLGSASSTSIVNDCDQIGGVTRCYRSQVMRTATTTVCSLKSPAATSTLAFGYARFSIASSSATNITLAKSSSPSASTTALANSVLAAGAQGTVVTIATSTTITLDPVSVFAPNTRFNVTVKGGDIGGMTGLAPSGVCGAQFVY